MKTQIRKLQLLNKLINPEWFYVITIHPSYIEYQGRYRSDLLKSLSRYFRFTPETGNGYLKAEKHNIKITLTD